MSYVWTDEKPSKPGWYFVRDKQTTRYSSLVIVPVYFSGNLCHLFDSVGTTKVLTLINKEWAGPIPEPEDSQWKVKY